MSSFDQAVSTRFHIYNSLFLNLPFAGIGRTGTLLPLFQQYCEEGFRNGKSPETIITEFGSEVVPQAPADERLNLLFQFVQYVERQVVLFDSVEDAAFEQINDITGRGTINGLLIQAAGEGRLEALRSRLESFGVRVVLTAHPTQFYPGPVLAILTDLEQAIRQNHLEDINLLLRQLGKTPFLRDKPTPFDEAVSLCWYLENVFYPSAPQVVEKLARGLSIPLSEWKNGSLIRIGFWPGGDRDGNPFVTSEVTLRVASLLQQTLLRSYHRDLRGIRRRLTFKGVDQLITRIERKIFGWMNGDEPAYTSPGELLGELEDVRQSLLTEHGSLFEDLVDRFILKVRLFGFFFASLDIRQESKRHRLVWESLLVASGRFASADQYRQLSEIDKIETLLASHPDMEAAPAEDPLVSEAIESFRVIRTVQHANGAEGCHRYVISNCGSALNVIEVFALARLIVQGKEPSLPLDIVPLFESIHDLADAPSVMERLYQIPAYRAHVSSRHNRQTIMLGFSDGTKDGGYLRANWSIYRAKEALTEVSRRHGIIVLFFDGRGGPPARGGGNTHDFYASLGDTIEDAEVQVTIQGQTVSSNYGKPVSCQFNLEQLISAGLENSVFPNRIHRFTSEERDLLERLAEEAYRSYLALRNHPKFVSYLERVTPLPYFADSNIGSRPAKRSQAAQLKLEDLRAIPFVGSWAQMKQNIPGFYGVGSALAALEKQGKGEPVVNLYKSSLYVRTLLNNSMMSLTKTYYPATTFLSKDAEFGEFWNTMYAEYTLAVKQLIRVSGLPSLMENNSQIKDSIKLRERIVLPLIAIQQYALQQIRAGKDEKGTFRRLVIRAMFGIINAARNSA
jgi:phosphoenolpyruvate carboxylase